MKLFAWLFLALLIIIIADVSCRGKNRRKSRSLKRNIKIRRPIVQLRNVRMKLNNNRRKKAAKKSKQVKVKAGKLAKIDFSSPQVSGPSGASGIPKKSDYFVSCKVSCLLSPEKLLLFSTAFANHVLVLNIWENVVFLPLDLKSPPVWVSFTCINNWYISVFLL